jgi:lipopolysaccharide transport protein LptA
MLLACCCSIASAQELLPAIRSDVPILVNADSSEYDDEKRMLKFTGLRLEQGELVVIADSAETAKLDFDDGLWLFEGNVTFMTQDATINGDWARLRFIAHQLAQANIRGEPADFSQQMPESDTRNTGQGKAIVYNFAKGILELRRDARFSDGANRISGDLITYDMRARKLSAGAGNSGQVKILIEPPRREEGTE